MQIDSGKSGHTHVFMIGAYKCVRDGKVGEVSTSLGGNLVTLHTIGAGTKSNISLTWRLVWVLSDENTDTGRSWESFIWSKSPEGVGRALSSEFKASALICSPVLL